jgi:hypothetical protein
MTVVVPDIAELFEEAFERAGLEMRSGYDLRTARRSLNLLTLEWQNRGLNLFTIESGTLPLVAGQTSYTLPTDTIDLIEHQLRTGTGVSQTDTQLERISVSTYAQQSVKALSGRPTQIYIARGATDVVATLWPVPDAAQTYQLFYYRLRGIPGLSSGVGTAAAIPPRFIPALVAGLAFEIASKRPAAAQRALVLKQLYEEQFQRAADEDRDRSSTFFSPASFGGL